jgi:GNAT superfamily N-acetyltransferase
LAQRSVVTTAVAGSSTIWRSHLHIQGKGIGQRLLEECISGLRGVGITRALILVSGENAKGRSFWLRNGWEDIPGAILIGLDL